MKNYDENYKKTKEYLEGIAKERGLECYDIVEDNYKYQYGLMLLSYDHNKEAYLAKKDVDSKLIECVDIEKIDEIINPMSEKEKIFLVYCLLYNIKIDWDDKEKTIKRAQLASDLCDELDGEYITLKAVIDDYIEGLNNGEEIDGRYFRDEFPNGYLGMEFLYEGLSRKLEDKSSTFQKYVKEYIEYPQYMFNND